MMDIKQIQKGAKIELAKREFFYFCNLLAPDFYKMDRQYLKVICDTLQAVYEENMYHPETGEKIKKFMMNIPPQHGKTRTLTYFSQWILGKNDEERILTASYNADAATDFSKYTRDGIAEEKNEEGNVVYSDIFPDRKLKRGSSSFTKWALAGQHFNYLGAGVGGSFTSKGGTVLIGDDLIKGAEEALNENHLDKVWTFYSGTFVSRVAADMGEPIEILNMTRWNKKDPCGRVIGDNPVKQISKYLYYSGEWLILKMEAYDAETDQMLCEDVLSKKRYNYLKSIMPDSIFKANYHQEPIDIKGVLFPTNDLQYFTLDEIEGKEAIAKIGYVDVADEGTDFLSAPFGKVFNKKIFINDVVFTQKPVEVTEPLVAQSIIDNESDLVIFESNNGGKSYARNVAKIVKEDDSHHCDIKWIPNMQNKETRILMKAGFIKKYFVFRSDYKPGSDYYYFMQQIITYVMMGKNTHDDAPDSITGLAAMLEAIHKRGVLGKDKENEKKSRRLHG